MLLIFLIDSPAFYTTFVILEFLGRAKEPILELCTVLVRLLQKFKLPKLNSACISLLYTKVAMM